MIEPTNSINPFVGQAAFVEGFALASLGPIGLVRIDGEDRYQWINSLSSQKLTEPGPSGSCLETLFLDAQGRIQFACGVIEADGIYLVVDWEVSPALVDYLQSMRFRLRVQVTDLSERYVAFAAADSRAGEVAARGSLDQVLVWRDPWPGVTEGGTEYFAGNHPAGDWPVNFYLVEADRADEFAATWLEQAGAVLAAAPDAYETESPIVIDGDVFEACRIAAWRPRQGAETDDRTLPAELDWLRTAVHIAKGCYTGQEAVARIINVGRPPRRLVFLQLDGSAKEMPKPGDSVTDGEGRPVGRVTSVANHYEMGPIALAVVSRQVPADEPLLAADVDVLQEVVVPVEGRSAASPKERPGAGLTPLNSRRGGGTGLGVGGSLSPSGRSGGGMGLGTGGGRSKRGMAIGRPDSGGSARGGGQPGTDSAGGAK